MSVVQDEYSEHHRPNIKQSVCLIIDLPPQEKDPESLKAALRDAVFDVVSTRYENTRPCPTKDSIRAEIRRPRG